MSHRHVTPEVGEVVDAAREAGEVADAVAVAVEEGLDVEAVDDRRLPPQVAGVGDLHSDSSRRRGSSSASAPLRGTAS